MMDDVLFTAHPQLRAFVSVYMDDIIIATEGEGLTEEELVALHERQLNQVINILDVNHLICGGKKKKIILKICQILWFSSREWYIPVQGTSSLFRSGSALRLLRPPLVPRLDHPGRIKQQEPPPPGLDHPGKSGGHTPWNRSTGTEQAAGATHPPDWIIRGQAAAIRPRLDHPGRSKQQVPPLPRLDHPGTRGGLRPRTGSSGAEQEGAATTSRA